MSDILVWLAHWLFWIAVWVGAVFIGLSIFVGLLSLAISYLGPFIPGDPLIGRLILSLVVGFVFLVIPGSWLSIFLDKRRREKRSKAIVG